MPLGIDDLQALGVQQQPPAAEQQPAQQQVQNNENAAVQTQAAATETQTQQPPTTEVNYGTFLEKEFGVSDAQALKQQLAEREQLKQQLEQLQQPSPYKTKFSQLLDELSEGVDEAHVPNLLRDIAELTNLDVASMSPKEKIAFDLKRQYPFLSAEDIEVKIASDYKLGDLEDETSKKLGETQMKIAAAEAEKRILELKNKVLTTNPSKAKADLAAAEQKILEGKAADIAKTVVNEIAVFPVKTDKFAVADFAMDKKVAAQIEQDVAAAIAANGNLSKEYAQSVARVMTYYYNEQAILNHIYSQVQSELHKQQILEEHNVQTNGLPTTTGGSVDPLVALANKVFTR